MPRRRDGMTAAAVSAAAEVSVSALIAPALVNGPDGGQEVSLAVPAS